MLIYKVLRAGEWARLERDGHTAGSPADLADGYIHLSTAEHVPGTLSKHFAGETGLVLLTLDTDMIAAGLKWEPARGGALFPHLYRDLNMQDVRDSRALRDGPGGPHLPGGME